MIIECEKLLGATSGVAVERVLEDRLREVNSRHRSEMTLSQVM